MAYIIEPWDSLANGGGDLNNNSGSSAGWYNQNDLSNPPVIVDDFFRGASGKSLRFTLANRTQDDVDAGSGNLTGVNTGNVRYWLDDEIDSGENLHVRFYCYWSTNFLCLPGGSGSKHLYFNSYDSKGASSNWRIRFAYQNIDGHWDEGADGLEGWQHTLDAHPVDTNHIGPNQPSPTTMFRGQWYAIELGVLLNTPGVPNGRIRWWIDGILQADYPNRNIRSSVSDPPSLDGTAPLTAFSFDQYFGGDSAESGAHPQQFVWIEDVVADNAYIGPDGEGGGGELRLQEDSDYTVMQGQTNPSIISVW